MDPLHSAISGAAVANRMNIPPRDTKWNTDRFTAGCSGRPQRHLWSGRGESADIPPRKNWHQRPGRSQVAYANELRSHPADDHQWRSIPGDGCT